MKISNATSQLAAFAMIKSLSDEKKYQSPYQILAEFIRSIIIDKKLYRFSAFEVKNLLSEMFGFNIPEAVIRSTARKMAGINLSNGIYIVTVTELGTDSLFVEKKKEVDEISTDTIAQLAKYLQEKTGGEAVPTDTLIQELVSFLMGEEATSGKHTDLIGEFILENEHNTDVQDYLNKVREGSILYIGLAHNIRETGSITKPITLYLGTEILFSLVGYNGTICKQLAEDFYKQVCIANSKGAQKIRLKYFPEARKEMDDFFSAAAAIVDGGDSLYDEKPAMAEIINGCDTASDVFVKQSDFYSKLQYRFAINEDTDSDFYNEVYFESNLESAEYIDDDDRKKKRETGIKYVSHINKLRNGQIFENDIDSAYLLVTNAKTTLLISREQTERLKREHGLDCVAAFAVTLDRITSLLWYKLGSGFGNSEYPSTLTAALRARVVLSASIAKKARQAYFDTKEQFDSGKISKEQLAGRIITLRNKPKLPEDLQGDGIDEVMDFSSSYLSRYEEEHKNNQKELEEKNRVLNNLKTESNKLILAKDATIDAQKKKISEINKSLAEKEGTIANQESHIKAQNAELEQYRRKESEKLARKKRRKNCSLFIWSIAWKLLLIAASTYAIIIICNHINPNISAAIGLSVGILGLLPAVFSIAKRDYKKYIKK